MRMSCAVERRLEENSGENGPAVEGHSLAGQKKMGQLKKKKTRIASVLGQLSKATLMVLLDWDVLHNRDPGKASCWWDIIWDGLQSV
ncbi:hypothetical protein PO909_028271 [Leuciscus waleckii]